MQQIFLETTQFSVICENDKHQFIQKYIYLPIIAYNIKVITIYNYIIFWWNIQLFTKTLTATIYITLKTNFLFPEREICESLFLWTIPRLVQLYRQKYILLSLFQPHYFYIQLYLYTVWKKIPTERK